MAAEELSVDRALPLLTMVTVTGGEYIVISAQSQLCRQQKPHSEVFHVSVFQCPQNAMQCVCGGRVKTELINVGEAGK